ncbi:hypothetical protein BU15DRAFT_52598 [Melanogaster broomeanus]|nr:hypothetical protein BU15DRAFT_52598 [Melanogaster broomeanus]
MTPHPANIDNKTVDVYDLPGLQGEVDTSIWKRIRSDRPSNKDIISAIVDINKKRGIDLVIHCLGPKDGIGPDYYKAVTSAVGSEVPIAAVVTRLERENGAMENWWPKNGAALESDMNMRFIDHACVTTLPQNDTSWRPRRVEGEKAVRDLISRRCTNKRAPPK